MMPIGIPALGEREAFGEVVDIRLRHSERDHQPSNRIARIGRDVAQIDSFFGVGGLFDHDHLFDHSGQIIGILEEPAISVSVIPRRERRAIAGDLPPGIVFAAR